MLAQGFAAVCLEQQSYTATKTLDPSQRSQTELEPVPGSVRCDEEIVKIAMSAKELKALKDKDIEVGDWVWLPYRGGKREGHVQKIALTADETLHPPKVALPPVCPGKLCQTGVPMHRCPAFEQIDSTAVASAGDIF